MKILVLTRKNIALVFAYVSEYMHGNYQKMHVNIMSIKGP